MVTHYHHFESAFVDSLLGENVVFARELLLIGSGSSELRAQLDAIGGDWLSLAGHH